MLSCWWRRRKRGKFLIRGLALMVMPLDRLQAVITKAEKIHVMIDSLETIKQFEALDDRYIQLRKLYNELLYAAKYIHHVCKNGEDQGELNIAIAKLEDAITKGEKGREEIASHE